MVLFPQSIWYHQSKMLEVDNFSRRCYEALSSPLPVLRREPGDEPSPNLAPFLTLKYGHIQDFSFL